MITNSLLGNIKDLRSYLIRNSYAMLAHLVELEDCIFSMHRKILKLEEENSRLKSLLHPEAAETEADPHPIPWKDTALHKALGVGRLGPSH